MESRKMFKSLDGEHILIVKNAEKAIENGVEITIGFEVGRHKKVYIRPCYYAEVNFEGRAYTREEVVEILLNRAKWQRVNSQEFWADQTLETIKRFLSGEVVSVEIDSTCNNGYTTEITYMSDGSIKTAGYADY